jgi:hypothetical protein
MWLIGRIEGGTLDPVTYYREVIGLRVVPELAAAALAAAVAAR